MHELMYVYFPDDIFTDWRRQPKHSKEAVLKTLHREFPNPSHLRFKDKLMQQHMGHVLKTRRGHARKAAMLRTLKPSFLSNEDWKRVKDELRQFPNRWQQQKLAAQVQRETTGFNRFGSGGKAHFRAYFVSSFVHGFFFVSTFVHGLHLLVLRPYTLHVAHMACP